jgi:murein L,D-transpeptidase YafK
MDNYNSLDWARLKKYMRPLATHKFKKSWVYRYGYRVVRRSNPHLVFWVCHRCYCIKATDQGRGILQTTKAILAASRYLKLHKIYKPGKAPTEKLEVTVYGKLISSKQRVSQAVANELAGFNHHEF